MMEKFCYWQVRVKEDFDENDEQKSWTCAAHLHEGRAMVCPYSSLKEAKEQDYPCVDAKSQVLEERRVPNSPSPEEVQQK